MNRAVAAALLKFSASTYTAFGPVAPWIQEPCSPGPMALVLRSRLHKNYCFAATPPNARANVAAQARASPYRTTQAKLS
jgi:hypothetical protein